MSNPSLSGGGGPSLDDVLVMLFGSAYSGASTEAGAGLRYSQAASNTEVT